MPIHAAIRTDSSVTIGTGHLFRCLTLADALRRDGGSVSFICRDLPGNLISRIEGLDFPVLRLPPGNSSIAFCGEKSRHPLRKETEWEIDARGTLRLLSETEKIDWLVVDHYALDERWEGEMRPVVRKIMVIDDTANRPHDCDLFLDQNFHKDHGLRYRGLLPQRCRKLFGPRYALLRPEFLEARKARKIHEGRVRRVLVFFGGTDPTNETEKALDAIRLLKRTDIHFNVIVGDTNPKRERIRRLCAGTGNARFYCHVKDMARMMARSDLAIGAVGTTTWERCYLGLPSITLTIAENQHPIGEQVSKAGAIRSLGWHANVNAADIAASIQEYLDAPLKLKKMSEKGMELMGGEFFEGAEGVLREMVVDVNATA
jgi:UDP-2,4-diacetamido-2,4,6-trideoxy-beta-L-altropyranose hydrolase